MSVHNPLDDPELAGHRDFFLRRQTRFEQEKNRILDTHGSLHEYANLHLRLGIHRLTDAFGRPFWRIDEFMPAARNVWLTTSRINFALRDEYSFTRRTDGIWELLLPFDALMHGDYIELRVQGQLPNTPVERRVPAFAKWVEQDRNVPEQWCARFWHPEKPYTFACDSVPRERRFPRVYEAHIGMAQPARGHKLGQVGSYAAFAADVLPRIKKAGYSAVQLMAVPEHPLYKSFGYQVGSYFAPSSRYGTPEDFMRLVDRAHSLGLSVLLDIAHGHACANTEQGLVRYDTGNIFFTDAQNQWGTPSFAFDREFVRRFLLSNCRYWLEEFHVDGFRFDAVGNMLYADYGVNDDFSQVESCFTGKDGSPRGNPWGETYLCLANALLHEMRHDGISIAEEFSGMPGLTCPPAQGGLGFDYRFAMGVPDFWAKAIRSPQPLGLTWYEMTNHRPYDRTISYVECHDQCINGKNAMIWRLLGTAMYTGMRRDTATWNISRGLAFYRLMRCLTLVSADAGYLNFMGNEFGHPEWLDETAHAHRQWHLTGDTDLFYAALADWDKAQLIKIVGEHLEDFAVPPLFRLLHEDNRILAFERGRFLFVFNFHETAPQTNLSIPATPGKYTEFLSSDEQRFGGHGNLAAHTPPTEHFSDPLSGRLTQNVALYLPPMTALILFRS